MLNWKKVSYWQSKAKKWGTDKLFHKSKLWILSHFPSEKASVENFARKADAKLLVQWVQSTVLLTVIKLDNKLRDGKGGKNSFHGVNLKMWFKFCLELRYLWVNAQW